jgi:hypothetical protein
MLRGCFAPRWVVRCLRVTDCMSAIAFGGLNLCYVRIYSQHLVRGSGSQVIPCTRRGLGKAAVSFTRPDNGKITFALHCGCYTRYPAAMPGLKPRAVVAP